jgi:hypothetical protein
LAAATAARAATARQQAHPSPSPSPLQSPYNSFTDQGRCQAVNKRGKKQCANKCMNGSRFCRTHHDITHF